MRIGGFILEDCVTLMKISRNEHHFSFYFDPAAILTSDKTTIRHHSRDHGEISPNRQDEASQMQSYPGLIYHKSTTC